MQAVNGTDVTIVPATTAESAVARVTHRAAVAAALHQLEPGSVAMAAELVELTNAQHPHGHLVWAISDDPSGPHASPGGCAGCTPPPNYNLRVDFVDATTGKWLEADETYSPKLPALPIVGVGHQ
ncbi:MAG: hypothetical protein ACRDY2_10535 [Acidimicrobiales bacterium]